MKFNKSDVTLHRAVDNSDPGFALKGFKLRWISSGVEVRRAGRIWQALKVSMLPENVVAEMKKVNPRWVEGEDTIRKRDQTLAFAPMAEVEKRRRENKEAQDANEAIFAGKRNIAGGRVQSEGSSSRERISEASEEFRQ